MSELLDMVLRAHGGLDRWRTFEQVSATIVSGGGLLPMKGIKIVPEPLEGIATIHHESTLIRPFGLGTRVLGEQHSGSPSQWGTNRNQDDSNHLVEYCRRSAHTGLLSSHNAGH